MKSEQESLVKYRIARAWDTLDDAKILASNRKWNSSINRLYYAAYYAVIDPRIDKVYHLQHLELLKM